MIAIATRREWTRLIVVARRFALNKTELTRLRRDEKTYTQFLPVLQLKQEQLQTEQLKLRRGLDEKRHEYEALYAAVRRAAPLLAEPILQDIRTLVGVDELEVVERSVAGVTVPELERVGFIDNEPSRFTLPAWVSRLLPSLRQLMQARLELMVVETQLALVSRELRKATQKVNLFEKVLLPETQEGIRRIGIALGDQQIAAVARGKLAKAKQSQARRQRATLLARSPGS